MPTLDELRKFCSEDVLELNPDIFAGSGASNPTRRKNKFNATKTNFEGEIFDSAKEARRYHQLRIMQMGDEISHLQRQVKYELQAATTDAQGRKVGAITYTADFVYQRQGKTIIEDCKSVITAKNESFRVRWRMLQAKFKDDPNVVCEIWAT